MTTAIAIKELTKTYANKFEALKGISLEVEQGDFFALLGPNGAGKSTTIGVLSTLVKKSGGIVEIFGKNVDSHVYETKLDLGVVPQEINFSQFERVKDIVMTQAGYYGMPRSLAAERCEKYLLKLDLWDKRNDRSRTLSGGMKRRLMIARALVHEPKLLILDEPTAGVDIELRRSMWEFLTELNESGTTIILTTHYLEEAEELCDRIAIINNGTLIANKTTRDLVDMAQEKVVVITVDRDVDVAPRSPLFQKVEVKAGRVLAITYSKAHANAGDVLGAVQAAGFGIADVSTREADLEHVFLNLTRAA